MRAFIVITTLVIFLCPHAFAGPKEDALQVLEKWTTAFTESDVDGIVELYSPDALFLGTGSKEVVSVPSGIRAYFERALLNDKPRGAMLNSYSVVEVSDSVVVFSGLDTVTGVRNGKQLISYGRVTIVVAKRDMGWKIIQFHRSALPK
jgi:uncharacterized protein (TIGR02246 family)